MEEARKQRRASGPVSRPSSKPREGKWSAVAAAAESPSSSPQPPGAAGRHGAAGSRASARLESEGTSEQDLRRISRVLRSLRAQRAATAACELPPGLGTPPGLQQPSSRRRQYSAADYADGSPDREAPRPLLQPALQQVDRSPERQRTHHRPRRGGQAQQEAHAAADQAEQRGGRRRRHSRSRRGSSASPTQAAAEQAARLPGGSAPGLWDAGERLAGGSGSRSGSAAARQEWPSADTKLGDLRWRTASGTEPPQQRGLQEPSRPGAPAWQPSQPADVSPELEALVARHAPGELHLLQAAGARPRPRRGPRLTDLLGSGDSSSQGSDCDSLAPSPAPQQAPQPCRAAAAPLQPGPGAGSEPGSPAAERADSLAFTVRDTSPVPSPEPPPAAERRLSGQSSAASERARAGAGVSERLTRQHWHAAAAGAERPQPRRSADGSQASRLSSDRAPARRQPQRPGRAGGSVRRAPADAADDTSPDQHSKVREFMRRRRAELAAAAQAQAAGEADPVLRRLQARKEAALAELEQVRARREVGARRPAQPQAAAQAATAERARARAQAAARADAHTHTHRSLASHPISPVPTFREPPAWGAGGGGSPPAGGGGPAAAGEGAEGEPRIIRSLVFTLGGGRVRVSERRPADAPASGRLLAAARLMQNAARRRQEAASGAPSAPPGGRAGAPRLRLRLPEADEAPEGTSGGGARASPGRDAAAGRAALPRLALSPRAAVAAPRVSSQAQAAATTGQQVAREQLWRMGTREGHRLRVAAMASRVADLQARIAALAAMAAPTPRGEPSPRGCPGAAASPGMGLLSTRSLPSHVEAVLGAGGLTARAPSPRLLAAAARLALPAQAGQPEAQQQPAVATARAEDRPASAAEQLPALTPVQHWAAAAEATSASKRKFAPEPTQDSSPEQGGRAPPSPERRPPPAQQPRSKLPRLGGSFAGAPAPVTVPSWADAVDAEPPSPAAPPAWLTAAAGSGSWGEQPVPAPEAAADDAEDSGHGSGALTQPESQELTSSRPGSGSEPAGSAQAAAGSGSEAAAAAGRGAAAAAAAESPSEGAGAAGRAASETLEERCAGFAASLASPLAAADRARELLSISDSERAADTAATAGTAELVQRRLSAGEEQLLLALDGSSSSVESGQLSAAPEALETASQDGSCSSSGGAARARPGSASSAESGAVSSRCRDSSAAGSRAPEPAAGGAQGDSGSSVTAAVQPSASSSRQEPAWEAGGGEELGAAALSSHSAAGSAGGSSCEAGAGQAQPLQKPASAVRADTGGFATQQLACSPELCTLEPLSPGRLPAAADVPALEPDSSSGGGSQAGPSPSSAHSLAADAQASSSAELPLEPSSSVSGPQAAAAALPSPAAASEAGSSCGRAGGAAPGDESAGGSPGWSARQQLDYWPLDDGSSARPGLPDQPAALQPSAGESAASESCPAGRLRRRSGTASTQAGRWQWPADAVAGAEAQPEEAGSSGQPAAGAATADAPAAESAAGSSPVSPDPLELTGELPADGPAPQQDGASEQPPSPREQAACCPPQPPQQQPPAEHQRSACEPAQVARQLGLSAELPALELAGSSSSGSSGGACGPAAPASPGQPEDSGSVGLSLDCDSSDEESGPAAAAAGAPAAAPPRAEQDVGCSEDSGDWRPAAAGESPRGTGAAASLGSDGAPPREPLLLQQDEAHAQAYASRCLDAFLGAGEWAVQPGRPAIGAGAYLAMERAAPKCEAQHMLNKALFDAVNESLALLLQPGRAAAGPGRRRLARLRPGSPAWQAALREEVGAALAAWCRPAAADDFRALLLADMAQDEAELEDCSAFAEEIERELTDELWEALLADASAAFCP